MSAFFTFRMPRLAAISPLLRDAICALSAKHISRLVQQRLWRSDLTVRWLDNQYWRTNLWKQNWHYKSVAYYNEAIKLLKSAIVDTHISTELLAAIAILCMYEILETIGSDWGIHLSAIPLLGTRSTEMSHYTSDSAIPTRMSDRSIFWNFVRQDLLFACEFFGNTCGRYRVRANRFSYQSDLQSTRS